MKFIVRGQIFDFLKDPLDCKNQNDCYRFFNNGGLVVEHGYIKDAGNFDSLKTIYPGHQIIDYSDSLVMPGFIDTHIHYPQIEIIGSFGRQLIDWLNEYTFTVEQKFNQLEYSRQIARYFVMELLRNGTTTCMTYATQSSISVDSIFDAASRYNLRLIAGKVLMNRNAPAAICDNVDSAIRDCECLVNKWHHFGRNLYAITPRFAITSDMHELKMAGELHRKYPDTYIQTHLAENRAELQSTLSLFPDCCDYLNVYEKAGLVNDHSIFAHCIYLSDSELKRLKASDSVIAHCPTSNLFLGSGLFSMKKAIESGIQTCIATDIGAGTSFSMLKTISDAYKIQQINGYVMNSLESFYRVTLGAAIALKLENKIGSFRTGNEADFIVLDYKIPDIQKYRMNYLKGMGQWDIEKLLFGLQTIGDDRNIKSVYIMGKKIDMDISSALSTSVQN